MEELKKLIATLMTRRKAFSLDTTCKYTINFDRENMLFVVTGTYRTANTNLCKKVKTSVGITFQEIHTLSTIAKYVRSA